MIELKNVNKSFGATPALVDVSLRIERGECVVLIGASGSGKSTLLKLMNRLLEPDSGALAFMGQDLRSMQPEALRRRMGYVIQSIGLFPHWNVARNIATVPTLLGWPPARISRRVDELLELLGLPAPRYRLRFPHELSGGQQQRVGVARALAADPEVLLMDEPFAALDAVNRAALQQALLRIHQATGKTIVFVTHDIDEALRLASRIMLLDHGRIVQVGTPAQLLEQPVNDWVRAFLGGNEAGLRRLGLHRVADVMRARERESASKSANEQADRETAMGPLLLATLTLREALLLFLAHRCAQGPVVDAQGRVIGVLHLADLTRPVLPRPVLPQPVPPRPAP